ncbi:hypothetical protein BH11PSE3_BH11PSE3_49750 [soil metagenome]
MTKSTKNRYGYLGTEPMALREQMDELVAALETMARAEGAEAIKAAAETVRRIAGQAGQLFDEVAGKAEVAAAAVGQGRGKLEGAIQSRPWVAVSVAAAAGFLLAALVRR